MAELILTSLPSGAAVQGVQATGAPSSATGTQPALPTLPTLPAGALIRGFVLNRDQQGNPILRTPQGDFTVQSDLFLKIGSDVVARVTTPGNTAQANILSVDGHSPQEAGNLPAGTQAATTTGQQAASATGTQARTAQGIPTQAAETQQAAQAPAVVRQSSTLTGTLIRPAGTSQTAQAALPAGTQITFRLVSATPPQAQAPVQAPAGEEAPAAAINTATETAAAPATAAATAPQVPATASPLYNAYTRSAGTTTVNVPVQATAAQAPQAAQTTAAVLPAQASTTVQAQVTRQDASGNSVAETPLGTVRLENAPPLPPGTRLTLQVLNTASPAAALEADATPADIPSLAGNWQGLGQIVDTLLQQSPDTATQFLRLAMPASAFGAKPQMGNLYPTAENLSAAISRFSNALSGGDLFTWLGGTVAAALQEHGHDPLLARAADEFDAMRALWVDARPGTWQAMFVPIMAEGQVRPLRMFVKRERKNKDQQNKKADTRFVVEMELTTTGALQLDGLVRKREGATQFDLMIRSQGGFSADEQRDIMGIYNAIGGATGYSGSVTFQQTNEFPVRPLDEIMAERHSGVVA